MQLQTANPQQIAATALVEKKEMARKRDRARQMKKSIADWIGKVPADETGYLKLISIENVLTGAGYAPVLRGGELPGSGPGKELSSAVAAFAERVRAASVDLRNKYAAARSSAVARHQARTGSGASGELQRRLALSGQ